MNDIIAVGPEHFYATNDRYFSSTLHLLTVILSMPWCNIVYYSPEEVREAAGGIQSGNGINISPDKRLFSAHFIVNNHNLHNESCNLEVYLNILHSNKVNLS